MGIIPDGVDVEFRDPCGQGQQHEGERFGAALDQLPRLGILQFAAKGSLQQRINLLSRRLPCHALELTKNLTERKWPISTSRRRSLGRKRLNSYAHRTSVVIA